MKKNILIIHESLRGGGAEKVLIDLLNHFDYNVYNVRLLLWEKDGIYLSQMPSDVEIIGMNNIVSFGNKVVQYFPYGMNRLYYKQILSKMLPDKPYDVIISFMEGISSKLHSFIMDYGMRNISWVHIDMKKSRWSECAFKYDIAAKKYYPYLDAIIFVSEGARTSFESIFGRKSMHKVIYNIQLPDKIRTMGAEKIDMQLDSKKFIVSCVGRLERQKRFDRVLEIAAKINDRGLDFEFWIIGEGSLENDLKNQAEKLGVSNMVRFLGYQTNPYKYMAKSDVFLLTSEVEGYGLVVGEAMSLAKPVVSTRVTGPDELLKNDIGILCDQNVDELTDALVSLYNSVDLYTMYSKRSFEKSKDFNPENTMNNIYSLIEGI